MQPSAAAKLFAQWAMFEGMMPYSGPQVQAVGDAELALMGPLTDDGKVILRTRQVVTVGFDVGERAIDVFTRRALPISKKVRGKLPAQIDDVAIRYRQGHQAPVGGVEPAAPFAGPAYTIRQQHGRDVLACGSSISVGNARDAGTLGCLVRDATGQLYGLSNNHVSASCSHAPFGLPIVAPGIIDVLPNSLNPFTLGLHSRALPMVPGTTDNVQAHSNRDAAIFQILDENVVTSFQGNAYDTPVAFMDPSGGMEVEKVGHTTGYTTGVVIAQLNGAFPVTYLSAHHNFNGNVFFDPVFVVAGNGDLFSDHGDSGSLVTTVDAQGVRHAVGIVIAGMPDATAPGGKLTLILPIGPALNDLQVQLVSGLNV